MYSRPVIHTLPGLSNDICYVPTSSILALAVWHCSLIIICLHFLWGMFVPITQATNFFSLSSICFQKFGVCGIDLPLFNSFNILTNIPLTCCLPVSQAFILHLMCYEPPSAYVAMWGLMIALCQLLLTAVGLSQWHFLDA